MDKLNQSTYNSLVFVFHFDDFTVSQTDLWHKFQTLHYWFHSSDSSVKILSYKNISTEKQKGVHAQVLHHNVKFIPPAFPHAFSLPLTLSLALVSLWTSIFLCLYNEYSWHKGSDLSFKLVFSCLCQTWSSHELPNNPFKLSNLTVTVIL